MTAAPSSLPRATLAAGAPCPCRGPIPVGATGAGQLASASCKVCSGWGTVASRWHGWTLEGETLSPPQAPSPPALGRALETACDCVLPYWRLHTERAGEPKANWVPLDARGDYHARKGCGTCGGSGRVEPPPPPSSLGHTRGSYCDCIWTNGHVGRRDCERCKGSGVIEPKPAGTPLSQAEVERRCTPPKLPYVPLTVADEALGASESRALPIVTEWVELSPTPEPARLTLAEVHALAERLWRERNPAGRVVVDQVSRRGHGAAQLLQTFLRCELDTAWAEVLFSVDPTEQQVADAIVQAWERVSDTIARGWRP